MKKFEPNPNGGLPSEEPPYRFGEGVTSTVQEEPPALTLEMMEKVCDDAAAKNHELNKGLLKALYAAGFRVLIGGGRPDLPVAILPASFAKAHDELQREAQERQVYYDNPLHWILPRHSILNGDQMS